MQQDHEREVRLGSAAAAAAEPVSAIENKSIMWPAPQGLYPSAGAAAGLCEPHSPLPQQQRQQQSQQHQQAGTWGMLNQDYNANGNGYAGGPVGPNWVWLPLQQQQQQQDQQHSLMDSMACSPTARSSWQHQLQLQQLEQHSPAAQAQLPEIPTPVQPVQMLLPPGSATSMWQPNEFMPLSQGDGDPAAQAQRLEQPELPGSAATIVNGASTSQRPTPFQHSATKTAVCDEACQPASLPASLPALTLAHSNSSVDIKPGTRSIKPDLRIDTRAEPAVRPPPIELDCSDRSPRQLPGHGVSQAPPLVLTQSGQYSSQQAGAAASLATTSLVQRLQQAQANAALAATLARRPSGSGALVLESPKGAQLALDQQQQQQLQALQLQQQQQQQVLQPQQQQRLAAQSQQQQQVLQTQGSSSDRLQHSSSGSLVSAAHTQRQQQQQQHQQQKQQQQQQQPLTGQLQEQQQEEPRREAQHRAVQELTQQPPALVLNAPSQQQLPYLMLSAPADVVLQQTSPGHSDSGPATSSLQLLPQQRAAEVWDTGKDPAGEWHTHGGVAAVPPEQVIAWPGGPVLRLVPGGTRAWLQQQALLQHLQQQQQLQQLQQMQQQQLLIEALRANQWQAQQQFLHEQRQGCSGPEQELLSRLAASSTHADVPDVAPHGEQYVQVLHGQQQGRQAAVQLGKRSREEDVQGQALDQDDDLMAAHLLLGLAGNGAGQDARRPRPSLSSKRRYRGASASPDSELYATREQDDNAQGLGFEEQQQDPQDREDWDEGGGWDPEAAEQRLGRALQRHVKAEASDDSLPTWPATKKTARREARHEAQRAWRASVGGPRQADATRSSWQAGGRERGGSGGGAGLLPPLVAPRTGNGSQRTAAAAREPEVRGGSDSRVPPVRLAKNTLSRAAVRSVFGNNVQFPVKAAVKLEVDNVLRPEVWEHCEFRQSADGMSVYLAGFPHSLVRNLLDLGLRREELALADGDASTEGSEGMDEERLRSRARTGTSGQTQARQPGVYDGQTIVRVLATKAFFHQASQEAAGGGVMTGGQLRGVLDRAAAQLSAVSQSELAGDENGV